MRNRLVSIVVLGLLLGLPVLAQAQLVLLDTFSDAIDPEIWRGFENASAVNTEAFRGVVSGKLAVELTSYGGTAANTGAPLGSFGLALTQPNPVTAVQAVVTVTDAVVEGCPANPTVTRARAQVIGAFFNDGNGGGGNRTGDILAVIQKVRDSNLGDRIEAVITRCPDATCTFPQTTLAFALFTTSWRERRADTLLLSWDSVNTQFLFTVNPGTPKEETHSLSYAGTSDTTPAVLPFRHISVTNSVANCTASRLGAFMGATFDNVMVNP